MNQTSILHTVLPLAELQLCWRLIYLNWGFDLSYNVSESYILFGVMLHSRQEIKYKMGREG